MVRRVVSTLFFSLFSLCLLAQTGSIKGTIKDAKTGEALIGAAVLIEGTTTGAAADVEGNFVIAKAPAGVHTITVSFISYQTKKIDNVRVEAGKTTLVNTALEPDAGIGLEEVVVTAERATNTEVAVITEIKQAEQIATGISAQQISRSQDRDAAQVIRRVPGISVNDDRFVNVRGLNERYNTVMLNDIITPSTEVDVKSFSFDLIPSAAIDRMLVFKSGAPELPGEFAGGVIKVYTKTIPDGNSFSVGFSSSYRASTTFNSVNDYKGDNLDWIGFGNGARKLPAGFPTTGQINQSTASEPVLNAFRSLPPYFNLSSKTALPDWRANVNFTRRFSLGGVEMTNISAVNYSFTRQFANIDQYRYLALNEATQVPDTQYVYNDAFYAENSRLGVMSNWGLLLSPNNKIEFRNLYNQMGFKETTLRGGAYIENNLDLNNYAFRYESRSIYSGQLSGTHNISDRFDVKWVGGYGYTHREEPDFRRFTSSRSRFSEGQFRIDVPTQNSPSLTQAARFFSNLNEHVLTGAGNAEYRLNLFNRTTDSTAGEDNLVKLRAGFYVEKRKRDFAARYFGYINPKFRFDLTELPPDQFFDPANISPQGVYYAEGTNTDDRYDAENLLIAGYAGAYIPFSKRFNASIGLRVENNRQQVRSQERGAGRPVNVDNEIFRPLPSANLTYNFSEKSLLRLGYTYSLNRPEFRELAPFVYYNFDLDVNVRGNPGLRTPKIHNFDARYEWYPNDGELISLGAFYKQFYDPIEVVILFAGSGTSYTYGNADQATNYGAELELRKGLTEVTQSRFLSNLSFVLNAALIFSEVKLDSAVFSGQQLRRPMQGQSPYLINFGATYNDVDHNFQVSALYNVTGPRIFAVGDNFLQGNVYEMPRNVIDLNVIKGINDHLEIRAGVQDLLNQPFRFLQDNNRDDKIEDGRDQNYRVYRRGSYVTLGINYRF